MKLAAFIHHASGLQGLGSKSRSRSLGNHILHLNSRSLSTPISITVCVRMRECYYGGGILYGVIHFDCSMMLRRVLLV